MEKFTLNCLKSKKLAIAKIFAYILTRDYNNSKILKRKTKVLSLVEIVFRNRTYNNQM